jgi:O-antigen/teichoic acid export membrane protein
MAARSVIAYLNSLWSRAPANDATGVRNQAFWRTMAGAYGLKVVTVGSNLVSVPLAAGYLGTERYGLWVTIGSFIGVLGLCEFGLGNNLTTLLAQARGKGDAEACSRYVSATFWAVLASAIALLAVFSLVQPWLDWPAIFNVKGPVATAEAPRAAFLIGVIAATQLVAALCGRIYSGLQQGYFGSMWQAGSVAAGLLALIVASRLHGGLVMLVIAMGLVPVLLQLVGLAWVLRVAECGRLLGPGRLIRADFSAVVGGGALMFLVNLQAIFWMSKDNVLIAHGLNLDEVGRYNTAWRVYTAAFGLLVGAVGGSLWPAYADAHARADVEWIRKTLRRTLRFGIAAMVGFGAVFVIAGPVFLEWYVGASLSADRSLLVWMGVYFTVLAVVNLLSYPLIALGSPHVVAFGGLIGGLLSVPLGFAVLERFGAAWSLLAVNVACVVGFILAPLWWANRRRSFV